MGTFISVRVGDIVRIGNDFWEVLGVYSGVVGQEDLVEIRPLTERPQSLPHGNTERFIPRQFFSVDGVIRYRATDDFGVANAIAEQLAVTHDPTQT